MNKFEAERRKAERLKESYPPGTRLMLLQMGDDPRPIEPNTKGTVRVVDDIITVSTIVIRAINSAVDKFLEISLAKGTEYLIKTYAITMLTKKEMINKIHFFLLDEIFLLLLKDVLAILPPYQTVYLGTKHITIKDLADKDLIRPRIFNLICNAMAIRRFGLGAISITAERKTKS